MAETESAASRRERQKTERRDAIVDAAARVFGEKGASVATMEDVAEAAEVSKGTLYLYFRSKDDLFVALTHRPMDVVLTRFEALEHLDLNGLALLRRLVETHAAVIHEHGAQMRLAMGTMCGGYAPAPGTPSLADYADRIRALRRSYFDAIARGVDDGSIRPSIDPREVAGALWAGMFGASFIRMNAERFREQVPDEPHPIDLDRIHESVANLLLSALENPENEG